MRGPLRQARRRAGLKSQSGPLTRTEAEAQKQKKGMIAARVNTGIYERYIPIYQYIPQYIPRYIPAAAAVYTTVYTIAAAVYTTVYTIAAAVYTTVYTIAAVYTSADKFEF